MVGDADMARNSVDKLDVAMAIHKAIAERVGEYRLEFRHDFGSFPWSYLNAKTEDITIGKIFYQADALPNSGKSVIVLMIWDGSEIPKMEEIPYSDPNLIDTIVARIKEIDTQGGFWNDV